LLLLLLACGSAPSTPPAAAPDCLSVGVDLDHPAHAALTARGLAGNGVTWAALLDAALRRHATVVDPDPGPIPEAPGFGFPSRVRYGGEVTWAVQDDEGHGAIVCAGSKGLMDAIRADVAAARADVALL